MEIHQARYFLAVCNELNFTRAAKKCNIAQPALTRAIQMLGGSLFNRQRTSVHLTELGKLILPYLEEVWQKSFIAKRVARDYTGGAPKQLTLGIMCTIAPKLLIQLLDRFRSTHPEIQVRLVDGKAQLLEERLLNFQIEAAIYCRPNQELDVRLNHLPLFKEQMMIVLPKEHKLSKYGSIRLAIWPGSTTSNGLSANSPI
jgi:LysR family hydrogen peroxide-inducible transcriptional activator